MTDLYRGKGRLARFVVVLLILGLGVVLPRADGVAQDSATPAASEICYRIRLWNALGETSSTETCTSVEAVLQASPPPPPAKPDVAFYPGSSINKVPAFTDAFKPFDMNWIVCNIGGTPTGGFQDSARLLESGSVVTTGSLSNPSLDPGICYTEGAYFDSGVQCGNWMFEVRLDSGNSVSESNEGNNFNSYGFIVNTGCEPPPE